MHRYCWQCHRGGIGCNAYCLCSCARPSCVIDFSAFWKRTKETFIRFATHLDRLFRVVRFNHVGFYADFCCKPLITMRLNVMQCQIFACGQLSSWWFSTRPSFSALISALPYLRPIIVSFVCLNLILLFCLVVCSACANVLFSILYPCLSNSAQLNLFCHCSFSVGSDLLDSQSVLYLSQYLASPLPWGIVLSWINDTCRVGVVLFGCENVLRRENRSL